jgi:ActR/RegA family two-component response regulator
VKARVATAAEALAAQAEFKPQVAVLDLDLGIGPTGIDVAIALRKKDPQHRDSFPNNVQGPTP